MTFLLRPALALAIILAPLATPTRAQDAAYDAASAFFSIFNPQRLTRISIQWMIGALRTRMEITYQGLTVTPDGKEAYLTDVALAPVLDWDIRRECVIGVDRIDISETGGPDDLAVHLEFIGAKVTPQCLEPSASAADTLAVAGFDGLVMERLFVDLDYVFNTSALTATMHAAIRDAVVIEAAAELDYIWLRARDDYGPGEDFEPVIGLAGLELRIEDAGALTALRPILPTMGIEPEALPAMVEGGLRDMLSPGEGLSMPANTAAFIGNTRLAVENFLEGGGAITLAARPDQVLWLGPQSFENPAILIETLALDASSGPLMARDAIDLALIAAAITGDTGAMTPEDKRAAAAHLMLTLRGPKASDAGRALLTPLAEGGDAEAAAILAEALADTDPETAYAHAIFAANSLPGRLALLDRAEAQLPLATILAIQNVAGANSPDTAAREAALIETPDVAGFRRAALAYLVGDGAPRSYRRAYAMASLAAAAGDRASIDLRDRLTRRLTARGGEDAALWRETTAMLADEALDIWVGGVGAKLTP